MMKLVEILAREFEKWPKGVDGIWQSSKDNELYLDGPPKNQWPEWLCDDRGYYGRVKKADWEAERAKLKAPKANGDGWVRHRGGKCPVDSDVMIQTVMRGENKSKFDPQVLTADSYSWKHVDSNSDVMYWRTHKPDEQPQIKLESGAEIIYSPGGPLISMEPADTMLAIRDRIRELDTQRAEVESTYQRQISEITQERESLVQRLAGEGLALVEVVVQPVEGMSDWRNWRIGDLAEVVSVYRFTQGELSVGDVVPIIDIDEQDGTVKAAAGCWGDVGGNYKWHSRPAS